MHACPNACGRQIPDQQFLCNVDSGRCPDAQIVAYGVAWDSGNTLVMSQAMIAILNTLAGLGGLTGKLI